MKTTRWAAGLMSAALLLTAPGLTQMALALGPGGGAPAIMSYATTSSYQVKVTADSLNIRKSANKNSDITGLLKKGDVCTIVDEEKDSRGVAWGKLENGKGWISLSYCQKTDGTSSNAVNYQVKVTANSLNIRKSASKSSASVGYLKKGDVCTIAAEQKDSRGVTWGKLENGKGWISLSYCQKTDGTSSNAVNYQVKVTANSLNIRKSASKSSASVGYLKKGDICTIVAEQKDSRGVTWGKLESGKGWVSLSYCKKTDGNSFTAYQVKVTADTLNIRKSASKDSASVGFLKKGNVMTIVAEQKDSRGVTWGKLENGDGWISLSYCAKVDSVPTFAKYNVKVTADSLYIRSKADKTSAINGVLKKGTTCTIVAEQKDSRGVTWGKLENGKGWISLSYCSKL